MRLGEVVYDGPPGGLTPEVLTEIYGEEDWEATIEAGEGTDEADPPAQAGALTAKA